MTKKEMWEAVKNSDETYDGLFFYGVKTTGIFCRPSCKSKLPKKENVCYFKSARQARKAGFHPCKRCRSDLLKFNPNHKIASEIKQILKGSAAKNKLISLEKIGLTSRRLSEIFKEEYGITPKEYADSLRLNKAKQMLETSNKKIIEIAFDSGFSDLSSFNRFFKRKTLKTPSEYRKEIISENLKTK